MKSPCWQCPMRKVGCHADCQAYLMFAEERELIRRKRITIGGLHNMSKELLRNLRRKELQTR